MITTEQWIEKAKAVHGDFYDYRLVVYVRAMDGVTIICPKHGDFCQRAQRHVTGTRCPDCAIEGRRMGRDEFIARAVAKRGEYYDYSRVVYVNKGKPVEIGCPAHGWTTQTPHEHLAGGGTLCCASNANQGCATFERRASAAHAGRYTYENDYVNNKTSIKVRCPVHGLFPILPFNHLKGSGCARCAVTGYNTSKPGMLYYLRVGDLYKIGITNRSVQERYNKIDLAQITIIEAIAFENGQEAYDLEQLYLKEYAADRYQGPDVLRDGNTELFTRDVLGLDI